MSTYTPISTVTVSATTSDVVFSGIPQTYTDLVLVSNARQGTNFASLNIRLNADSGSNYSDTVVLGDGSTAASARQSNVTSMRTGLLPTTNEQVSILHFMNYANTTTNKTVISRGNSAANQTRAGVGLWRNTAAITSITIVNPGGGETITGTFTLYGIGAGSPKAFGGDEVRTDGTYWYHIYRSSGIFAPMQNLSCDYLVVAGGGGGGGGANNARGGGGGGAGGYRTANGFSTTGGTNYVVTVGAGGTAGAVDGAGGKGNNSVFATITSEGGGLGGRTGFDAGPNAGGSGGSGGGGGNHLGSAGTGTSGQGNNGGAGQNNQVNGGAGGGGGGSNSAGSAGASDVGGTGGTGTATSITGSSVTYAAGGKGGDRATGTAGSAGTANQGNGGGGGGGNNGLGGAGGSGIVVIRYSAVV